MPNLLSRLGRPLGAPARAAQTKASATAPLIAMHAHGQPVWTPRDYAALAREGYAKNAVVYRCVRMIAEAAGALAWLVHEEGRELDDHPLTGLLARPNPRQAGHDFFEALYGHLLIAGNAYVEAVGLEGHPRELHVLRPDRMKVVPGTDGWPEAYDYSTGGETLRFDMSGEGVPPILHLTLFHPTDDHYGMSPLEAAATGVDIHNAAGSWNKALLDNSARPSGALVWLPGETGAALSGEQFERLRAELEASYAGAANAGRPLLLEGGLDWKQIGMSPKDMDFMAAKDGAAREIALAFGVPPMLLGIPGDNTYANYAEANRAFWRQTVLPLAHRTGAALAHWLAPALGRVRLSADLDAIEALAAEREKLWSRVEAATFLSVNEKRLAVGYGELGGGEGIAALGEGAEER